MVEIATVVASVLGPGMPPAHTVVVELREPVCHKCQLLIPKALDLLLRVLNLGSSLVVNLYGLELAEELVHGESLVVG